MSIRLSLPHISLSPVFPSFSFQAPDQTGHLAIAQECVCLLTTLGHVLYTKYMTKSSAHSSTQWEYFPFPFTPLSCSHCPSSACTHVPHQPIHKPGSGFFLLFQLVVQDPPCGHRYQPGDRHWLCPHAVYWCPLAPLRLNPRGSNSIL